jgi:hypothetical protein
MSSVEDAFDMMYRTDMYSEGYTVGTLDPDECAKFAVDPLDCNYLAKDIVDSD